MGQAFGDHKSDQPAPFKHLPVEESRPVSIITLGKSEMVMGGAGFQLRQITGEVPALWEKLGDAGLHRSGGVDALQEQQGLCFMEPARDGAQK